MKTGRRRIFTTESREKTLAWCDRPTTALDIFTTFEPAPLLPSRRQGHLMSLTVYGAPLSPFVRKVRLCLAEKDLDYALEIILPFGQPAWYRELNPLGRIPALKDGDFSLADSSVICQYLEDNYPERTALLGRNAEQRARVRWLEKYSDYELGPLCTFGVFRN